MYHPVPLMPPANLSEAQSLIAAGQYDRAVALLERTDHVRQWVGRGLEAASALAIIGFGAWLLATR